eukprot:s801_g1.t1
MSLTPAESLELQRLLAKAKSKPMPQCSAEEDEFSVFDPDTGMFINPVTGDSIDCWNAAEQDLFIGAMTDGAKRREDQLSSQDAKRMMMPKAKAHAGPVSSYGHATGYTSQEAMSVPPFPGAGGSEMPDMNLSKLPPLPAGVPDVDTWGHTMIEFGQFKSSSMSYFELVTSTENRAMSYVKWCRSRSGSAAGQLKDLCDFMAHFFAETENESGPIIPGTGITRRLKK